MDEDHLETLLDEAVHVANEHPTIANNVDDPLHEYLRYAGLRLLEDDTDRCLATAVDVTVGYGMDAPMADNWRAMVA